MGKKTWWVFAVLQVIGEVCQWTWPSTHSSIGPVLWYGAFLLLLPGNFGSAYLIEKLLWMHGLTLLQMQLMEVPLEIGLNLAVWALVARAWSYGAAKIRQMHLPADQRL